MATLDLISLHGGAPANFLDVGGGASEQVVADAMSILLDDKNVKVIFINIFGGILRCDVLARGVIKALKQRGTALPVIARIEGTNIERAFRSSSNQPPDRDDTFAGWGESRDREAERVVMRIRQDWGSILCEKTLSPSPL
jgi:hypothetical protein